MPRSGYQLRVRDPQTLLLLPLLARAHRHAPILRTNAVDTRELSAYESRLTPRAVSEKPVHHRPRILEAGLNLTDVRKVHSAVAFSLHLRSCVFVKAACGKTARAVCAADGG